MDSREYLERIIYDILDEATDDADLDAAQRVAITTSIADFVMERFAFVGTVNPPDWMDEQEKQPWLLRRH